ncbi:sigma-70 family RNA polymerase sigma factor [Kitasatospora sp. YST-16]|uniref:sigma-70 family RNA polymerase sigma factor n=1 Tax=Kitasatospora sp. YST-16 TaxID=2998080 RepID=UPI002283DC1C|nr:sigma-70 family RNA polymerase sigma factor [Kitasatospora sp. YST-16]WAL70463.1 sigma-70 family RNA polymerase sigma factor [Kitasatospora sp. YST-16]WNW36502.1 sigma-70 family RNA polymerase sigma factor [Streptomyces sp. Li-HN-5-13]
MPNTRRSGPDAGTVAAARAGDRQALEHLVAHSLPLVYNIVGRALNGHADTDDVVQETLLRMVRGLSELRDPAAFRSWLVAIAVRQVRNRQQDRAAALDRSAPIEEAEAIPDPALDFAGLTVLRLGLTEQRREIAEATRWLDPDDRELLALWWLKETGELEQADLVAALGLSSGHAAVRTGRMKKQLDLSRLLVRALAADPRCPGLAATTTGWDGTPGPLWRKRLARHVRDCARCTGERNGLLPAERLLYGLPLLAVPPSLDPARILAALTPGGPGGHSGSGEPGGSHSDGPGGHSGSSGGAPGRGSGHRRPRPVRTAKPLLAKPVLGGAALVLVAAAVLVGAELVPGQDTVPAAAPGPSGAVAPPTAAEAAAPPEPDGASPSAPPTPSPSAPPASSPVPSESVPRSATAAASAPVAQDAAVVASARKGVGVWAFDGASQALAASGAGWYYTWGTQHPGISTPASASFVPMIWGASSVTDAALAQARANGPYLLGFNEPDMAAQSNLTVDRALELWPQLMRAGQVLGSPAVAYGADTPGGWLDRFMAGADAKGYRVDFITLHWYGGDFRTPQAVQQLTAYLEAVHRRYHKPIWLTEYALIDFSQGTRFPSADQQAAFVTASTEALDALPYLQRYAWFGLGADPAKPSSGLFTDGTTATAAGRAYRAAR